MTPHQRKISAIVKNLLDWYPKNARDLPWRRTADPYGIWVSEIMLQQTQVKTVIPYWNRWMAALPTLQDLALARPEKVLKLWEGLGYYSRARNLQKAAQQIVAEHGGVFPRDHSRMLELPGIGRYTAGAVASIAFNQPQPILDGNVIRVLTRLHGIAENPREKAVNQRLWTLADELVNEAAKNGPATLPTGTPRCSHLNQSLMELGALICTPRQPRCGECPLQKKCAAFQTRRTETIPNLGQRAKPTAVFLAAFVVENQGRHLVRQRSAGEVNAHLWEFPNFTVTGRHPTAEELLDLAQNNLGLTLGEPAPLKTIRHSITRYRITLRVFRAGVLGKAGLKKTPAGHRWLKTGSLTQLPFTSAHKKILAELMA